MTTTHTPGPWQCNPANGHVSTASEPSLHLGIVHAPEALGRDRFDARAANARLIAAAPEMLAALKTIMAGVAGCQRAPEWEAARAAIASATGEA